MTDTSTLTASGAVISRAQQRRTEILQELEHRDIVRHIEAHFWVPPDITNLQPHIIRLEPHQRVVLRYAFQRNEQGRLRYTTIIYSAVKKSGKTAIGGAVGRWVAETWGRFGDIYYVGNDAAQARERGYAAMRQSIELTPGFERNRKRLPERWNVLDTYSQCLSTGSKVHAIATDYTGEAGANPIITIWTELWGFTYKADVRFWAEMAPSPTRPDSIRFVETYAGFDGESELLQELYGKVVGSGRQLTVQDLMDVLGPQYESMCFEEAPNPDSLVPMYVNDAAGIFAYWDSGLQARRMPWQKGEHGARYYASEEVTQHTDAQYRRFHLNEWVSAESEFIPIELWDACVNPLPLQVAERTPLVVGLDAATTGDCFGLVVVSRDPDNPADGVAVRAARKWAPPKGGRIDFDDVAGVLQWLRDNCNVVQVCYDPHQLDYFVKKQREALGFWFEEFQQGDRRLKADKQLYDLIMVKRIRHDGNTDLRQHIQNCNAKIPKDQDDKLRLTKKSDTRKIDLAVALSMAAAECLRLNI